MIDINVLNDDEKQALVCLFFARLPRQDSRYAKRTEYWSVLEKRYNRKWSTYKNDKDAMDPFFPDNKRKGWTDKPLEKRSKTLKTVYDEYKDAEDAELETAVKEIIEKCKRELDDTSFVALRIKQPESAHALINGQKELVIDGVQDLSEVLTVGRIVFVALGGDVKTTKVDWSTGFYAIAHVSRAPYEFGYERDRRGKD